MIFRTPDYYSKFCCIADKCRDSCCIGWEIDIDSETSDFYNNVCGEFGRRLRENISDGCFILDENERCPFLNRRNLCDIYTELGEEHLCQICSDHPRYFEWFDGLKEGGIGMCCEAAARLILSDDCTFSETEIADEECSEYDNELFELLMSARTAIISLLNEKNICEAINSAVDFADKLQYNIDNSIYSLPEFSDAGYDKTADMSGILHYYTGLEPIDKDWIPYLEKCINTDCSGISLNAEHEKYLRRIAVYFVFRYFMKGTFDGEILSRVKLMAVSTAVIAHLWKCSFAENVECGFEECCEIARRYSKEIEYCEENIEMLSDAFYTEDIFMGGRIFEI